MNREQLENIIKEKKIKVKILDGLDNAIIGLTLNGVKGNHVVYSKKKCISEIKKWGMKKNEAVDFFINNTVAIIPNCGRNAPIIIEP